MRLTGFLSVGCDTVTVHVQCMYRAGTVHVQCIMYSPMYSKYYKLIVVGSLWHRASSVLCPESVAGRDRRRAGEVQWRRCSK